ncbi:MAG: hypothetical protein GY814_16140, partial [Gammaproteobacteria bacterium]|nr:hypothetical protein [Gammaproteobacteria bacterium]
MLDPVNTNPTDPNQNLTRIQRPVHTQCPECKTKFRVNDDQLR